MLLSPNRMGGGRFVLYTIGALVMAFLLLPIIFIAALSFGDSRWLQFPPPGWTLQWYRDVLYDPRWIDSILVSAKVGLVVMVLAVLLGLPASFAVVRGRFFGREVLRAFFISPMIVPLVILAIALYGFFLRVGVNGSFLGFVAGHLVIALPFSIICISNALETFDESIERAAVICGASPAQAIWRITLPSIRSGILAGALFSFLASWDEVVIGIFLASPELQTLPVRMWSTLRNDLTPVVAAVSTLLIAMTIVILAVVAIIRRDRAR